MNFLHHMKRTLVLAWPMMLAQGLSLFVLIIDTIMVGQAGGNELAYLSAGRSLVLVLIMVGVGLLSGIVILTARADGAGMIALCGRIWRGGLYYALLLGAIAVVLVSVGGPLVLRWIGLGPALVEGGGRYLAFMGFSLPGTYFLIASVYFLQGLSRPKPGMVAMLLLAPLNVLMNWVLIYGHWGAPAMGAAGAALATALCQWIGAFGLFFYIFTRAELRSYGVHGGRLTWLWREGRALRTFGYPLGLASGLEFIGTTAVVMFAGLMGVKIIASLEIVSNLQIFAFIAAYGVATATAVRISNAVGRGDRGDIPWAALAGLTIALCTMVPFVVAYAWMPETFFRIFTKDAEIHAVAATMLPFLFVGLFFDAIQFTFLLALRAAGDQWMASILQVTAFLFVMAPAAWICAFVLDLGPPGLMAGFLIGVLTAALLLGMRFRVVCRRLATLAQG